MKRVILTAVVVLLAFSSKLSGQFTDPQVSGNFFAYEVLTAGYTGSINAGDTVYYEWYYSPSNTLITTNATYTVLESDTTKQIYLKVIQKYILTDTLVKEASTSPVAVNAFPKALNVSIVGTARSGMTVYGTYFYFDAENNSQASPVLKWYHGDDDSGLNPVEVSSGSASYKIKDTDTLKYIGFSVKPAATTGSTPSPITYTTPTWVGQVVNDAPVASSVSVNAPSVINVTNVVTGVYDYTDTEGDAEGNSVFEWWKSPDNNFTNASKIGGASGIAYQVLMLDTGKYLFFRVKPVAKTGRLNGSTVRSNATSRINTPPYASSVTVTGSVTIGSVLTGNWVYHDRDGDDSSHSQQYKWYADNVEITGETGRTLTLTYAHEGKKIKFEVTPVADDGYPNTGTAVKSAETAEVYDSSPSVPVASNVCIDGTREENGVLTGKYTYTYAPKAEGTSLFKWYRNSIEISGATTKYYTLQAGDLDDDIQFEVKPVSVGPNPKQGNPVTSDPMARITMDKKFFTVNEKDTILTATPPGGYFWGEGVSNGKFYPSNVDYTHSPIDLNYHVNVKICSQDVVNKITVSPSTVTFLGFDQYYCQNGPPDPVKVGGTPKTYTTRDLYYIEYNPFSYVRLGDTSCVLNPATISSARQPYLYYYAENPFTYEYQYLFLPIDVEPLIDISINLTDNSVYCKNDPKVKLIVNQPGGSFSGPVSGDYFDPSLAVGSNYVVYTYESNRHCISKDSVHVLINDIPNVDFAIKDTCIINDSDTTLFLDKTTGVPLARWFWSFSEPGGPTDTIPEPQFLYTTGGAHVVTLIGASAFGCADTITKTINLGRKPVADFTWLNECYHTDDSIRLYDATDHPLDITSRTWKFNADPVLITSVNPKYPQNSPGYLHVRYIVNTAYRTCHDTIEKDIYIRPSVTLEADSIYTEDFQSGQGGWVKDYEALNSWSFGKPDRPVINTTAGTDTAWFTRYELANQKVESSSVISPCFNFLIERPMIKMNLWKRFDLNRDGAALQYKVGDEIEWYIVGTLDDGIKWYNSTLIKGKPGGDKTGWTAGTNNSKDNTWVESSHELDELSGKTDVKFRVAYGSDGTSEDNDGIAFDDIWIGSRTRGVLLEHFTNNSSQAARDATVLVSDLAITDTLDVINIQYHTNFPGADPFYNDNPADASARTLFYGLTRTPYTFIDGGADRNNYATLFDYVLADLDVNDVTRRGLISPKFNIDLNATVAGGIVSVTGSIKSVYPFSSGNLTLYLAVTQKEVHQPPDANGDTIFYNVFRKFIPDAGGINLNKTWAKDEVYTLTEKTWVISNIQNASDIEVIAFLQNNLTKEVYQAESVITKVLVGINDVVKGNYSGFMVYPNPSSGRLSIRFENPLLMNADIRICDFTGSEVRNYKAGAGSEEMVIENLSLKPGIYLVSVLSGGTNLGYKKIIVSND